MRTGLDDGFLSFETPVHRLLPSPLRGRGAGGEGASQAAMCPRQPPMTLRIPTQPARPTVAALVAAMVPVRVILAETGVAGVASAHFEDFAIGLHASRLRLGFRMHARASEKI